MRTRHSIVFPLPTSPVTLTIPSPAVTAYTSASRVAPRLAPAKKNSVCGVMRNGASRRPKCSRYIVMGGPVGRSGAVAGGGCRVGGIRRGEFSTGAARGLEAAVERAARDAEDLGRL